MFIDQFDKSDLEFLKDTKHYQAIDNIDKLMELHRQQEILYKKMQFALLLKALHVEGHKKAYIVTTKIGNGKTKSNLFTDKDKAFKFQQMKYSRRTIQSYNLDKYIKE